MSVFDDFQQIPPFGIIQFYGTVLISLIYLFCLPAMRG
jgi:hypothetical protein